MLTDTGPLVALINRNDPHHERCKAAVRQWPAAPLLTTWPCWTEAMYLLYRAGGYPAQATLWRWRAGGQVRLLELAELEIDRVAVLMAKYRDRPMDLADASLVVIAERLGLRQVFTVDGDFHIYRLADGAALESVPYRA
ncbi:MAG: PIN domain-containing protein [Candidatus Contendobacter sp.]|jgi:hypothetical protein|nr:PIN domain-containing protein [Candidatus Contendobacter sp.]